MASSGTIVSYTADELRAMRARGQDRTDWAKFDSITDEELDALIAADPDDDDSPVDPARIVTGFPDTPLFRRVTLDPDVRAALPEDGEAMTRTVNAILRAHFARADAA